MDETEIDTPSAPGTPDTTAAPEPSPESDYAKYRGKCKKYSEALIRERPDLNLRLVRGYYYDYVWGEQAHWWCEAPDGTRYDPTARQFPSKGHGAYVEFDGFYECEVCGVRVAEEDVVPCGSYPTCSNRCAMRLVL